LRVISGSAKGRVLAAFSGRNIRPTSDRLRETIFSILFSQMGSLTGKRVLDLFAGTGAMAIEALSRGAAEAFLVEKSRAATVLIRQNLRHCKLEYSARVLMEDVSSALLRLRGDRFDLIFVDPPYGQNILPPVLSKIDALNLLTPEGILCAEGCKSDEVSEKVGALTRFKKNRCGSTLVHFFHHVPEHDQ